MRYTKNSHFYYLNSLWNFDVHWKWYWFFLNNFKINEGSHLGVYLLSYQHETTIELAFYLGVRANKPLDNLRFSMGYKTSKHDRDVQRFPWFGWKMSINCKGEREIHNILCHTILHPINLVMNATTFLIVFINVIKNHTYICMQVP